MKQKDIFIILGVILLIVSCKEYTKKDEEIRPNFLFILVDDQSPFELKVYDSTSILDTPNINKLAEEGMVIETARHMGSWIGAVCSPSRHMIMSGRTLWHLPSKGRSYQNPNEPDSLELHTIGAVFNQAGYSTMRTCKEGNSYQKANEQFKVVRDATKREATEEGGSAWHAEQVLDYLDNRELNQEENPFLIYLGFSHPHDTRDGTPELLAKYGAVNHTDTSAIPSLNNKLPPLPVNYLSEHPFFHGHPGLRDEERVSGVWKNRDEATVRNEIGREYACSENIDIQIGKVLNRLEELGEIDNTYIIYTSDHGIAIGRHGLMGKQNLYEHTLRVPFIVKGPGINKGIRKEGNVYLLDILPTLCDLANIDIPKTVEGLSLEPLLKGSENIVRDVMYGVYSGGTKPGMRSVVKGDWKLIKYDLMNGEVRETQLFNLAQNNNEFLAEHEKDDAMKTNLALNPKYKNKLMEMEALLAEQMSVYDDPYALWDQNK
jgi:arylsulfatase A-like enzyme